MEVNYRSGKKEFKAWQHDKSVPQLEYENWLEKVVSLRPNEAGISFIFKDEEAKRQ